MKLQELKANLDRIQEVKPIDRQIDEDTQIMGFIRTDNGLNLFLLYTEDKVGGPEQTGSVNVCGRQTNRTDLKRFAKEEQNPFMAVKTVEADGQKFSVSGSMNVRCSESEWESVFLLETFLRAGWQPRKLGEKDLRKLFIHSMEIEGKFEKIPDMDSGADIRFRMQEVSRKVLTEQPVLLEVGADYPDRLEFGNKETGKRHWAQINRVRLIDMWEGLPEEMKEYLGDMCPQGMCFPLIEYECEENLFLQFYTKEWLEAVPESRKGCSSFFVAPKEKTGRLGLRLQTALIQQPVAADAKEIEAELFRYSFEEIPEDIVLSETNA